MIALDTPYIVASCSFALHYFYFSALMQKILSYPLTRQLSLEDKDVLWKFRFYLTSNKRVCTMFTHTYIHAYMHTYMHTCIHAYIHTYIHTHIHTYLPSFLPT